MSASIVDEELGPAPIARSPLKLEVILPQQISKCLNHMSGLSLSGQHNITETITIGRLSAAKSIHSFEVKSRFLFWFKNHIKSLDKFRENFV